MNAKLESSRVVALKEKGAKDYRAGLPISAYYGISPKGLKQFGMTRWTESGQAVYEMGWRDARKTVQTAVEKIAKSPAWNKVLVCESCLADATERSQEVFDALLSDATVSAIVHKTAGRNRLEEELKEMIYASLT
jgi:hypothetical protein